MFERFTAQARQAVHLALSEAKVLGADRIGTEHLLLGLAHARSGPAADALRAAGLDAAKLRPLASARAEGAPLDVDALALLGIDLDQVRRAAEAAFGPGALDRPARPAGSRTRFRMTQDAKDAMAAGLRVAHGRHDRELTSGHLLAGLIEQGDNEALRLLAAADVDPAALRADVLRRMAAAA
ncbi:MAG TPA: Clp protease N-terminal domain-containing protein [Streptosporangiaceae bacterium]|nr:Clp protease N-terminal domain-containing protein [Streptosporangiaceae bacterium]